MFLLFYLLYLSVYFSIPFCIAIFYAIPYIYNMFVQHPRFEFVELRWSFELLDEHTHTCSINTYPHIEKHTIYTMNIYASIQTHHVHTLVFFFLFFFYLFMHVYEVKDLKQIIIYIHYSSSHIRLILIICNIVIIIIIILIWRRNGVGNSRFALWCAQRVVAFLPVYRSVCSHSQLYHI